MFKIRRKRKSADNNEDTMTPDQTGTRRKGPRSRFLLKVFDALRHRSRNKHGKAGALDVDGTRNDQKSADKTVLPNGNADRTTAGQGPTTKVVSPQDPLGKKDVENFFSGAPQFSASTTNAQLHFAAAFPWDFDLKTRDLRDARPIPHIAFSGTTLCPHLVTNHSEAGPNISPSAYDIGVREMPSMLSATGTEPGSIGFQYFLEESVADSFHKQEDDNAPGDVFEHFNNFELLESQPEKLGLRKFSLPDVSERLIELGTTRTEPQPSRSDDLLKKLKDGELQRHLYGKVLTPPKLDRSATDPTGLKMQIETLIKILNLRRVWYDFSEVEWRIRAGQLLFTDNDVADGNLSEPEDGLSERDVVLLQLLLACELHIRLEMLAALKVEVIKNDINLTKEDVARFFDSETRKTKWDLVLASRFLDQIIATQNTKSKVVRKSQRVLASILSMSTNETMVMVEEPSIAFLPRRQEQQLKGLFDFQRALLWPGGESFEENLALALVPDEPGALSPSIYATPLSTPGTLTPRSFRSSRESGYFAKSTPSSPEMTPRSFLLQPPPAFSLSGNPTQQQKALIGGWLTRSYLTGFIMPGEAISHLLISAVLENDAEAITALGENANLYGGFVYKERSFWSKYCIVGRVFACLTDSRECMGWISSAVCPEGYGDGWLDVYSASIPHANREQAEAIEKQTAFLGEGDGREAKFADLSLPQDAMDQPSATSIRFKSLRLRAADSSSRASVSSVNLTTLLADLAFTVHDNTTTASENADNSDIEILPLQHLVHFVSAFPCTPPKLDATRRLSEVHDAKTRLEPAHPLHKSYHYRSVHATELLNRSFSVPDEDGEFCTVVDARGDQTLELLSRAWCSSEGYHALIARVGTTCLSCVVREAKGLGIAIVIRIGTV